MRRDLERRNLGAEACFQRILIKGRFIRRDDAALDIFSVYRMAYAEYFRFADTVLRVERCLDLRGRNIFTALDDDILAAADDVKEPVVIEITEITGVEPAVLVDRLLFSRKTIVSFHDIAVVVNNDLADTLFPFLENIACRVHDPDILDTGNMTDGP